MDTDSLKSCAKELAMNCSSQFMKGMVVSFGLYTFLIGFIFFIFMIIGGIYKYVYLKDDKTDGKTDGKTPTPSSTLS